MISSDYDPDNIFAKILNGNQPCFKVYEDDKTFCFLDIMPRGQGHTLIIPKSPARNLLDVDTKTWLAVAHTTKKLARVLVGAFQADGIMVQQFNESASGQIVFHLHVHLIPRFHGILLKSEGRDLENSTVLAADAQKILNYLQQNTSL